MTNNRIEPLSGDPLNGLHCSRKYDLTRLPVSVACLRPVPKVSFSCATVFGSAKIDADLLLPARAVEGPDPGGLSSIPYLGKVHTR